LNKCNDRNEQDKNLTEERFNKRKRKILGHEIDNYEELKISKLPLLKTWNAKNVETDFFFKVPE